MGVKYYFNYNKYFTEEKKRLKDVEHLGIGPNKNFKTFDKREVIKTEKEGLFFMKKSSFVIRCRKEWLDCDYRGDYEN